MNTVIIVIIGVLLAAFLIFLLPGIIRKVRSGSSQASGSLSKKDLHKGQFRIPELTKQEEALLHFTLTAFSANLPAGSPPMFKEAKNIMPKYYKKQPLSANEMTVMMMLLSQLTNSGDEKTTGIAGQIMMKFQADPENIKSLNKLAGK